MFEGIKQLFQQAPKMCDRRQNVINVNFIERRRSDRRQDKEGRMQWLARAMKFRSDYL
jgi:hypothetical protein